MIWFLIGYMWLYIHRPFEVWSWLAEFRVERVFMLLIILAWVITPKRLVFNRLHLAFVAFISLVLLSWIASPVMQVGTVTVENYLKVFVFYVVLVTTVHREEDLKKIVGAFLVIMGLYMMHSFREYLNGRHVYRMGIARMVGVDAMYSDPNSFAATVVYALPMMIPFWYQNSKKWVRPALLGYVALSVLCILLTGSRTGFIGMLAVGAFLVFSSRHRIKFLFLLVLISPLIWMSLPEENQNRFLSIIDPSLAPANARESAMGRWVYFNRSLELWPDRPVLGHGPKAFAAVGGFAKQQAHTLYAQLIAENGGLGILAFLGILVCFFLNAFEIRDLYRGDDFDKQDFLYQLSRSISFSIFLLLLMGLGGHNLYRYTWLWYGAFQAIALHCVRHRTVQKPSIERPPYWDPYLEPGRTPV